MDANALTVGLLIGFIAGVLVAALVYLFMRV